MGPVPSLRLSAFEVRLAQPFHPLDDDDVRIGASAMDPVLPGSAFYFFFICLERDFIF